MNTVDIIAVKRDGGSLTDEEISYLVEGYTRGDIPDYQMAAFLMAVYINGMDRRETVSLTRAMEASGDTVDLSGINGIKVDKHSTGGVGDKTTMIVGPLAAACGVPVAKMSGRGLGFTGGTVDKLESIPGFRTSVEEDEFIKQVNDIGIALIGQTGQIAPADKKIYALRDVTATVGDLSLITSSVMSKKLAAGTDAIVLDVKCGSGAFMKTLEEAAELAELMVDIGNSAGKRTVAMITDMQQPLGNAVGNALEVVEAVDVLSNRGPDDITELSVKLAGMMIYLGGRADSPDSGESAARQALADGRALAKFRELIEAQGGDPRIADDTSLLPQAEMSLELKARKSGYIAEIDAMKIGQASQHTGAGREKKEDEIDLSAGIVLCAKIGDRTEKGDCLCRIYGNDEKKLKAALEELEGAVRIEDEKTEAPALIKKVIEQR